MNMRIQIGTRNSRLALWQAEYVAECLEDYGLDAELLPISTVGDKTLNKTIAKIGSKGVFTEELESQLRNGETHIAVHSAKDLQSTLPSGMEIIAYTEREEANDVIVSYNQDFEFDESQKLVLGSSSVRRVAMMKHYYPKVRVSDVRGNIQTRMQKLDEGTYDALILAKAGVIRSGLEKHIVVDLPLDQFTPAVGQGAIAVQASPKLDDKTRQKIREAINHLPTEACLLAERRYLQKMDGGCSIPAFAHAQWTGEDQITIHGGIISLNGKQIVRKTISGKPNEAEKIGESLAREVLKNGGAEILKEIRAK